jgi:hypothetical protein
MDGMDGWRVRRQSNPLLPFCDLLLSSSMHHAEAAKTRRRKNAVRPLRWRKRVNAVDPFWDAFSPSIEEQMS